MHFLEQFSLSSALRIDKPFIYPEYFPLSFEESFIVFHPISKPAKTYDYWQDVLALIIKQLPDNIKILRIGDKGEPNFEHCINIQGHTSLNNAAYLIEKAHSYLGTDTFSQHFASHFNKKMLVLFSSSPSGNSGPYFGNKENQVLIDAPRQGKPSYAYEENPKTINNIKPEEIASKFLKLIDVEYKDEFESVFFGSEYKKPKVMVFIPDQQLAAPPNVIPEIRMDLNHDEEILESIVSKRAIYLVTQKTINLELLKRYRSNIKCLVYLVTEENSPAFPAACRSLGIQTIMYSELPPEKIQELKIHYYEIGVINPLNRLDAAKEQELKEIAVSGRLYYRSQKFFNHKGLRYSSKAAFLAGASKPDNTDFEPVAPLADSELFWNSGQDFYFVKKTENLAESV